MPYDALRAFWHKLIVHKFYKIVSEVHLYEPRKIEARGTQTIGQIPSCIKFQPENQHFFRVFIFLADLGKARAAALQTQL